MHYYKNVVDGYIVSLEERETPASGDEITEAQHNEILSILDNRPTAPDGYGYRLTEKMQWELYEIPVIDENNEHEVM